MSVTKSNSTCFVIDHDHGALERLAVAEGFGSVQAADDTEAVAKALTESWILAFVHIDSIPWKKLYESIADERVVVRFSTQGFPPTPPLGRNVLALHCLKKTTDLDALDVKALAAVCSQVGAIAGFRAGLIPPSVQSLIAFEEPHRLRALHILLQGVLALWASDPGHTASQKSSSLLGVGSIPRLPIKGFAQVEFFRRGLGLQVNGVLDDKTKRTFRAGILRELGLVDFEKVPAIEGLLNHVLDSKDTDDIAPDIVVSGFEAVDRFLCKL